MENPNVGIFRSFPLGYIDVLEKPSSLPLGGVDLEFSLAAPGGRGLGGGCLCIQGSVCHLSGHLTPLFSPEYPWPSDASQARCPVFYPLQEINISGCLPGWGRGSHSVEWNKKLEITASKTAFFPAFCTFAILCIPSSKGAWRPFSAFLPDGLSSFSPLAS